MTKLNLRSIATPKWADVFGSFSRYVGESVDLESAIANGWTLEQQRLVRKGPFPLFVSYVRTTGGAARITAIDFELETTAICGGHCIQSEVGGPIACLEWTGERSDDEIRKRFAEMEDDIKLILTTASKGRHFLREKLRTFRFGLGGASRS